MTFYEFVINEMMIYFCPSISFKLTKWLPSKFNSYNHLLNCYFNLATNPSFKNWFDNSYYDLYLRWQFEYNNGAEKLFLLMNKETNGKYENEIKTIIKYCEEKSDNLHTIRYYLSKSFCSPDSNEEMKKVFERIYFEEKEF
jgi:hypothetical protein